jgi:hypothetical protein
MKKLILFLLLIAGISQSQTTTFIPTGGATIFDLQSNGTPVHIIQDKNNPDNIHAVYMSSGYNDTTFAQRTVQYYFSSDRGQTWNLLTDFSFFGRTGFPAISLLSTGSALISMNRGTVPRSYTFADAFPGLGSFTDLGTSNCGGVDACLRASNNVNLFNKFYILNSAGFASGLSVTTPSYTNCAVIPDVYGFSNKSSMAVGADGRIGIAFISDSSGDVSYMELQEDGTISVSPYKIFDSFVDPDNTFTGAFLSISLTFSGNTPNVVFDVAKQNTTGSFYPKEPAGIRFWSPLLPGSNPNKSKYIARNDSSGSYPAYIPFYKAYGNDVLTSICRPSIGVMSNLSYMAVVFMSSTPNTKIKNSDTISYNSLYITYSSNNGLSWRRPERITPDELIDWTYPSISSFNSVPNPYYTANIVATRDSIPGSYVENPSFGKSLAEQYYIRVNNNVIIEPVTVTETSGNIKYNDNNQLVTNGIVKALRFDQSTGQVVVTTTSPIDANGNYALSFDIPYYSHYIVAYPNSEPNADFIPTYYPQTLNWAAASTINSGINNTNINIGVFRKTTVNGTDVMMGTVNKVQNSLCYTLPQANIILKSGSSYVGFAESNGSGRYTFANLPNGSYEVIASKLGYSTSTQNLQLSNPVTDSVNFALNQILIGITSISNIIPNEFNLHQNYPNPFNPVTNIKFDIPTSSFVTLKVYDILGKEIASLVNEVKPGGSYMVDFSASALTSGVYFYRIETESYTETKRMIILK